MDVRYKNSGEPPYVCSQCWQQISDRTIRSKIKELEENGKVSDQRKED